MTFKEVLEGIESGKSYRRPHWQFGYYITKFACLAPNTGIALCREALEDDWEEVPEGYFEELKKSYSAYHIYDRQVKE